LYDAVSAGQSSAEILLLRLLLGVISCFTARASSAPVADFGGEQWLFCSVGAIALALSKENVSSNIYNIYNQNVNS
jgi:hypothetical protein